MRALLDNRLELLAETTTLYPANIAATIFVHLLRDPISGRPRAWGLHRLAQDGPPEEPRCWVTAHEAEEPLHASKRSSRPYGPGGGQPSRQTRGRIW